MRKILLVIISGMFFFDLPAQEAEKNIMSGNVFYRNKQYLEAEFQYRKALDKSPSNTVARYNYANAIYRTGNADEAVTTLDTLLRTEKDNKLRAPSFYNSGAILSSQYEKAKEAANKVEGKPEMPATVSTALLEKSIEAYKNTLRINPDDTEARENLQKALLELKKNQPPPKKDDQKKKKQDQQQKQKKPQPQMNQKEAEQRLKLLEQKEKQVQQRLQKEKAKTGGSQTKDW
ncbi:MAG TPA: tetratricopeptide repeat protein [Chitinophagaceae bacterium]